jgi:hypothetical protein
MVGASVHAEAGLAVDAWWRPTVRLSAAFSQSPTVVPGDRADTGAATFTLIAGRAALCPLEFRGGESLVVRPCANLEIGRLEGSGSVIDNGSITTPRTGHALRLATGQSLLTRACLSGRVWLEMEAGATEPLVRQSFVFSHPDVTVRSTPFVEIAIALGLGMYFP